MTESHVLRWIEKANAEVGRSPIHFVSSHADEIIGGGGKTLNEALDLLPIVTQNLTRPMHARLALPFGYAEELDVNLPDLAVVPMASSSEPPSIYLFTGDFLSLSSDREEYRCPYAQTPWGDSYTAEYVCSRSLQDRDRNWEYSRTVWVRHRESR